ncbi:hypothetical protein PTKU64_94230 (plasmid) [Paraburkholderia terrae]|uniref:Uncharacterized protein n=1 Tax=Paraburkholderia terrae TaxID=311230 RepID=A0ABM7U3B4_9BURK|nr:hypothetical protein [Paraburkholderia terrae]BCZ85748.1 hypothetical protein PTKU64_94230 [Paraburkholderia terrae]
MAQDFAPDDGESGEAMPDREVARLVLELDRLITLNRRTVAIRYEVHGISLPVSETLDRAELMVLTALVQTYGPGVFSDDFGTVRQRIAECGAVVVLQQVAFADRPGWGMQRYGGGGPVGGVAARLQDARPVFEELCRQFPDLFLAEARSLLARFVTSCAAPDAGHDGEGHDG